MRNFGLSILITIFSIAAPANSDMVTKEIYCHVTLNHKGHKKDLLSNSYVTKETAAFEIGKFDSTNVTVSTFPSTNILVVNATGKMHATATGSQWITLLIGREKQYEVTCTIVDKLDDEYDWKKEIQ